MSDKCTHEFQVSGVARYDQTNQRIRYHTKCDGCGAEWLKSISDPYEPNFKPTPPS